jgi:hypothetical protein
VAVPVRPVKAGTAGLDLKMLAQSVVDQCPRRMRKRRGLVATDCSGTAIDKGVVQPSAFCRFGHRQHPVLAQRYGHVGRLTGPTQLAIRDVDGGDAALRAHHQDLGIGRVHEYSAL